MFGPPTSALKRIRECDTETLKILSMEIVDALFNGNVRESIMVEHVRIVKIKLDEYFGLPSSNKEITEDLGRIQDRKKIEKDARRIVDDSLCESLKLVQEAIAEGENSDRKKKEDL